MSFVKGSVQCALATMAADAQRSDPEKLAMFIASKTELQHRPLAATQEVGCGWVSSADPTMAMETDPIAPCGDRFVFVDLRFDRKRVHSALLKAECRKREAARRRELVAAGEMKEKDKLSKDERETIKREALDALLPNAPVSVSVVPVMFDLKPTVNVGDQVAVWIGSKSQAVIDSVIEHLAATFGEVPSFHDLIETPVADLGLYLVWKSCFEPTFQVVGQEWTVTVGKSLKLSFDSGVVNKVALSGGDIAQSNRLAECLRDDGSIADACFELADQDGSSHSLKLDSKGGIAVSGLPGGRDELETRYDRGAWLDRFFSRTVPALLGGFADKSLDDMRAQLVSQQSFEEELAEV